MENGGDGKPFIIRATNWGSQGLLLQRVFEESIVWQQWEESTSSTWIRCQSQHFGPCHMSLLLVTMATAFTEPSVQTVFATKKCVCTLIAEHNLSFTAAQPLKNLCKRLSEDKSALTKLSVSNQRVSYLGTHGLAPGFRQILCKVKKKLIFLWKLKKLLMSTWTEIMKIFPFDHQSIHHQFSSSLRTYILLNFLSIFIIYFRLFNSVLAASSFSHEATVPLFAMLQ